MKRILLYFIAFLLASNALRSQEEFIVPSRLLTIFPFTQFAGGIIILKAQFGSFPDSLNFILDTGSGGISLDSTLVKRLKLTPEPSDKTIRGIAGIRKVDFLYNQVLRLPGLIVDSLNFHINNYDILTSVYGEPIDGIIGYSVLSRYIFKVNYDNSHIEVWSKGTLKYPRGGYLLKPFVNTLPLQPVQVRDVKSVTTRFLYDMGAGMNLVLSSDFVKDSMFIDNKRKRFRKEAEGIGGAIDMWLTVIKEVKLGPYKFRNVPVYIFDDVYNVTSYPFLGGLLGNDLLRRFNAILNYGNREIHLTPNSHYRDPFEYSYSGIELYYWEGKIIIGDVAKDSPAEMAGLVEGDLVIAVDKSFSQNLQEYKTALQSVQERVKIIVLRNGKLEEFDFKVKNIRRK